MDLSEKISDAPFEIIRYILDYLNYKDQLRFCQTNNRYISYSPTYYNYWVKNKSWTINRYRFIIDIRKWKDQFNDIINTKSVPI